MDIATNINGMLNFETRRSPWWLELTIGILSVVLGFLLFTIPVKTVLVLVLILGYYWVFTGIFHIVNLFVDRTAWGWKLFLGLLSIIAGIIVLRYPLLGAITFPALLILFLGIQGVVVGMTGVMLAFKGGGWGQAIMGMLSLIFGTILVANYQSLTAVVTLIWIVAFASLIGGALQIIDAILHRNA